jgi:hypothetical protein
MEMIALNLIVQIIVQVMESALITSVFVTRTLFVQIVVWNTVQIIVQEMVNVIRDIVNVSLDLTETAVSF